METNTVERELRQLEQQYWQAIQDKDVESAMRLTDDPCVVTGAQGIGKIDRQSMAKMMKAASYTLQSFKLGDDMVVRRVAEDVAIVAYKVHEELTVEGKPVKLDAADASIWVRRKGQWVCALHTESLAGDPFGRDRHPTK